MAEIQEYSWGDFTGLTLDHVPASAFDGEIVGSCFHQEFPWTIVFPAEARSTFVRCNLDNCAIPPGCTVDPTCCNRQIEVQKDLEHWHVDEGGRPTRPLNEESFVAFGLSVDPADIPALTLRKPLRQLAKEQERSTVKDGLSIAIASRMMADADTAGGAIVSAALSVHIHPDETIRYVAAIVASQTHPNGRPKYGLLRNRDRGSWSIRTLPDAEVE